MSLKAIVTQDEFDNFSEEIQGHYAEQDKQLILDVRPVKGFELVNSGGLRKAVQQERSNVDKLKEKLKDFEGIDPEASRAALKKVEEIAEWDPDKKLAEAKAQYEKQLADKFEQDRVKLTQKHISEMEGVGKSMETVTKQLEETLIDAAATKAIADAKGSVNLLKYPIKAMTRMAVNEDGQRFVEIIGDDGLARLSTKAGSTQPMTISELVEEFKQDYEYARAFDGSGATGSGATGSEGGTGSQSHIISADAASDPARYRAAKDAATKAGKTLTIGD